MTTEFTGADIGNVSNNASNNASNDAALIAIKHQDTFVLRRPIEQSLERVIAILEKNSKLLFVEEKRLFLEEDMLLVDNAYYLQTHS